MIDGKDVGSVSPRDRDIAMVFQNYALYPHMTVRENLSFSLKMRKERDEVIESRIKEAADLLDISSLLDRKPRALSGGQRQRVAMGRAIVRKPRIFLFDEPLSNLDARLRVSMRVELKKLHQRLSTTMIYVTHDQVEAMTLGQTIIIMDQGLVRQVDTPDRIYSAPSSPFVAGFIGSPAMNLLDGVLEKKEAEWFFQCGQLIFSLLPAKGPSSINRGEHAVLGIRPEDIQLEKTTHLGTSLHGEIEVVENLGADCLIHVVVGDQRLVARAPRSGRYYPGDSISLYLPYERLHLFINDRRFDLS